MNTIVIVIIAVTLALCIGFIVGHGRYDKQDESSKSDTVFETEGKTTGGTPGYWDDDKPQYVQVVETGQGLPTRVDCSLLQDGTNWHYCQIELYMFYRCGRTFIKCGLYGQGKASTTPNPQAEFKDRASKVAALFQGMHLTIFPPVGKYPSASLGRILCGLEQLGHVLVYASLLICRQDFAEQGLNIAVESYSHSHLAVLTETNGGEPASRKMNADKNKYPPSNDAECFTYYLRPTTLEPGPETNINGWIASHMPRSMLAMQNAYYIAANALMNTACNRPFGWKSLMLTPVLPIPLPPEIEGIIQTWMETWINCFENPLIPKPGDPNANGPHNFKGVWNYNADPAADMLNVPVAQGPPDPFAIYASFARNMIRKPKETNENTDLHVRGFGPFIELFNSNIVAKFENIVLATAYTLKYHEVWLDQLVHFCEFIVETLRDLKTLNQQENPVAALNASFEEFYYLFMSCTTTPNCKELCTGIPIISAALQVCLNHYITLHGLDDETYASPWIDVDAAAANMSSYLYASNNECDLQCVYDLAAKLITD